MVCENYESCGNFLYNFESSIATDDGNFISTKYYCPSCYREINVNLANEELLVAEQGSQGIQPPTLVGGLNPYEKTKHEPIVVER